MRGLLCLCSAIKLCPLPAGRIPAGSRRVRRRCGRGGARRRRCSPGRGRTPGSRRPSGPRYRAFARRTRGPRRRLRQTAPCRRPGRANRPRRAARAGRCIPPLRPAGLRGGRGKALELRAAERRAHKAARGERAAQPGRQRGDVGGGPVVDERVGPDGPAAVFPPPAVDHHLAAYKARKQGGGRLGRAQVAEGEHKTSSLCLIR